MYENCQSVSDGDVNGRACVKCTGCDNLIYRYSLRVKTITLCPQCKRWSPASEDRSSLTSHSSIPVSRTSSPSHLTCCSERLASLESISLKRPRDSSPTAVCAKRTNVQLSERVLFVGPCLPESSNGISDDGVDPPWVCTLLSRFNRLETRINDHLTSIEASLLELSHTHTASIEHNTNSIAGVDERVTAEIVAIRPDSDQAFAAMRAEIGRACDQSRAAAVATVGDHDTCEVRLSGIPLSVDVTSSAAAERIVFALGLDRLVPI
ncbi:hypothetical protein TKK_0014683 [Trichogramma kaykai]